MPAATRIGGMRLCCTLSCEVVSMTTYAGSPSPSERFVSLRLKLPTGGQGISSRASTLLHRSNKPLSRSVSTPPDIPLGVTSLPDEIHEPAILTVRSLMVPWARCACRPPAAITVPQTRDQVEGLSTTISLLCERVTRRWSRIKGHRHLRRICRLHDDSQVRFGIFSEAGVSRVTAFPLLR